MSAYQIFILQIMAAFAEVGLGFVQNSDVGIVADGAVFVGCCRMDHGGLEFFFDITVAAEAEGNLFGDQVGLSLFEMRDVADQAVIIFENGVFFPGGQLCRQIFMASQAKALWVVLKQLRVYGVVSFVALLTRTKVVTGVHLGGTKSFENLVVTTQTDVTGWELQLSVEEGTVRIVALYAVGLGVWLVDARFIDRFVMALKADGSSAVYQKVVIV